MPERPSRPRLNPARPAPRRPIHPVRRELFERQETVADLAIATGYSKNSLAKVLAGDHHPWGKLRAAIADALDKPEHELFPDVDR